MTWTDLGEIVPTNFKKITIESSNYNPNIDSNITITITVEDQNDEGVENWAVPLKIDGTSINNIVTNANGVATYTYTCTEWGNHRISVESASSFINVGGWKQVANETQYQVYENVDSYYVVINTSVTFSSTSWAGVFTIPEPYRPLIHIPLSCTDKQVNGRFTSTGAVQVINLSSTERTTGVNGICVIKK